MEKKFGVGILGATGIVGQQYIAKLSSHPWFEVRFLAASERSAQKKYAQAVENRWHLPQSIPLDIANQRVHNLDEIDKALDCCQFVFSALTNDAAALYEERYAHAGLPVISNASFHRKSDDIPIIIAEINSDHCAIIPFQQKKRGWTKGFIITKPNCSLQSYMIPLAPLHKHFVVKKIFVTTMQALSGAGYPGISAWDISGNVIPYIAHEEEKSETEPLKIWGLIQNEKIVSETKVKISAQCNRVAVLDGHMACVDVEFETKPLKEQIMEIWSSYQSCPQKMLLPSAPNPVINYCCEENRPQPRLDRDTGSGMSISVGRLRESSIGHFRFVALSHNTIRGAAGGGILNAELLVKQGFIS